ncbi:MAG TPA: bifunctional RNase H/acid phosphatase [Nocardioidaceae bacterium]|nr:bifunctional RNase H/acid phosphatase [Nocardioidaceae bacterium]
MSYRSVQIEADGGSRGNPGPSAYGAVLYDAETRTVIAEKAAAIGRATNNVAEYRGLIAGLELYHEHAEGAALEVRMDSKLVVQQMSGAWAIKHPDMKVLAGEAQGLVPPKTTWSWIPREQNKYADRILNEVLDGQSPAVETDSAEDTLLEAEETTRRKPPWEQGPPTTLILVRHGETDHTRDKKFSGFGGDNPGLNDDGRAQVQATAEWLAPIAESVDAVVTSPLLRTRESAEILAATLGRDVEVEHGIAEAAFGVWDGLTFADARALDEAAFDKWITSFDLPAGGTGESVNEVEARVRDARDRLIAAHPGKTVVAASHVTPIKLLVKLALDMPLESIFRTELAPASVTIISWYPDGHPVLRLFNGRPADVLASTLSF